MLRPGRPFETVWSEWASESGEEGGAHLTFASENGRFPVRRTGRCLSNKDLDDQPDF